MPAFKVEFDETERMNESSRIRDKYPDRIPVICEKSTKSSSSMKDIDKKKYLVPCDLTAGQFVYVIRKRLNLPPEQAIYISVNGSIPPTASLMSTIYSEHKDADGFLYCTYTGENVFGAVGAAGGLLYAIFEGFKWIIHLFAHHKVAQLKGVALS